ncbi:MAG TPA: phenylalanine--tRNA ligase subunit alpha [Terriglobia bacterium]|nr:phenylalanine--tRNA ligase subunit alpha [Terriglobia bacterium]
MTIDEKVGKTLEELGVGDAAGVEALFAGVRSAFANETHEFFSQPAGNPKVLRDRWLSRKHGLVARIDEHWLKAASKEIKPAVGREFNQFRQWVADQLPPGLSAVSSKPMSPEAWVRLTESEDLTLPGYRRPLGSIHPVIRVQREIEEIFLNLGFSIETGPEIESVYYNFDALNIPESHPSRDDWDTLYIDSKTVLRTHTSPVQIRAMEKYGAPLYIIVPGKCYRHDNPDATHSPMFHQIEGLAVDTDIAFADLKGTLDFFAKKFFGEKVRTSFRPSFFPFTEPSGEVAVSCIACDGEGCRVCKQSGWMEVMGCGMVHPDVLRNCGIDPERHSGWAFGLGVDRFAMAKYDINDIQLFFQSDARFLEQF